MYWSLCCSTLLYCAHLWALRYIEDVNKVQYNFHKRLLGLPQGSPSYGMRKELGVSSLKGMILKQALRFLNKILAHETSRYTKQCVLALLELHHNKTTRMTHNWISQLHHLVNPYATELQWNKEMGITLNDYMPGIIDAIKLEELNSDNQRAQNSTTFHLYSLLPSNPFTPAPYLCLPLTSNIYRAIAQCRLSRGTFWTHEGTVQLGINERCTRCNSESYDILHHLLFQCQATNTAREAFLRNKSNKTPSELESLVFLNPINKEEALKFVRFLSVCLNIVLKHTHNSNEG